MQRPNPSPLVQVVSALKQMNQRTFALEVIAKFEATAQTFEQHDEIAYLYTECKDYRKAVTALEACLAVCADGRALYAIRTNLSKVLNYLNDPAQSLIYSKANKSVLPNDLETDLEIGFSHYLLGDYAKSEAIMHGLLANSDLPTELRNRVRYNLGTYKMENGQFQDGLHDLVTLGHKSGILPVKTLPNIPLWTGFPEEGKTLIILAEGGIGDELIGIRFMSHVTALGMTPVWVTNHKSLEAVFLRNGYACTTDVRTINPENAVYVQAFYLPVHLGLTEEQVWQGPYLTPDPDRLTKWLSRLPDKPTIAVKWFGNTEYDQDLHRSIPVAHMESLNDLAPVVSLQLEGSPFPMMDLGSEITDIEDTLAIISMCDVTVTSCTSVAHMAGALGANVIVCPPIVSYYCWLGRDDEQSHWYGPSVHVIRQRHHKNWDYVFVRVRELVNEMI